MAQLQCDENPNGPLNAIAFLKRDRSGSTKVMRSVATWVQKVDKFYNYPGATFLAMAIVTQDLKMGVSTKTLNNVYGDDFIPVIECMLGTLYEKVNKPSWPCIVTEKLDGIRRILVKNEDGALFFPNKNYSKAPSL